MTPIRDLIRESSRLHKTRHLRHAWVRAKLHLHERKLQPKVPNYAFYAEQYSSYRQATGYDLKSLNEIRWERWIEKAHRLILS